MADHVTTGSTPSEHGKPASSDVDTAEDIQVAMGDDAEGAIGSEAPAEAGGVGDRR